MKIGIILAILLLAGVTQFVAARVPDGPYPTTQVNGTRIEFGHSPNWVVPCAPSITFKAPWNNSGFCMMLEGDYVVVYDGRHVGQWITRGYFGDLAVQQATVDVWRFRDEDDYDYIKLDNRWIFGKAMWTYAHPPVTVPVGTCNTSPCGSSGDNWFDYNQRLIRLTGGGTQPWLRSIISIYRGVRIEADTPGTVVTEANLFYFEPTETGANVTLGQSNVFKAPNGSRWSSEGVWVDSDSTAARAQKDPVFKAQFLRLLQDDATFRAQVKTLLGIP